MLTIAAPTEPTSPTSVLLQAKVGREQGDRGLDGGVLRSSSRMYDSCLAYLGSGQTRSALPLILSIVIHTVGNLDGFLGLDHCYG